MVGDPENLPTGEVVNLVTPGSLGRFRPHVRTVYTSLTPSVSSSEGSRVADHRLNPVMGSDPEVGEVEPDLERNLHPHRSTPREERSIPL